MGGHPVLDFVNTLAWRLDPARAVDRVQGAEAWVRWAVTAGLFTADSPGALLRAEAAESVPAAATTAALKDLRATLCSVLDALVDDESLLEPPAGEWKALRRALVLAREDGQPAPGLPPAVAIRHGPPRRPPSRAGAADGGPAQRGQPAPGPAL